MTAVRMGAAVLIALLALVALCGCASNGTPPAGAAGAGVPGLVGGTKIELFTCSNWNDSDIATKMAAVGTIRGFVGGQVSGAGANGTGMVLDDNDAYEFFEQSCSPVYASHFLLYKLYGRAAGFAGQAP
jgi:hypothetical protein